MTMNDKLMADCQPVPRYALSIVVPAYNEEPRLAATLRDILTYRRQQGICAELIVVDDGSTDGTEAGIASLIPQLTYVYQDHRGVSAARNRRAALARAPP